MNIKAVKIIIFLEKIILLLKVKIVINITAKTKPSDLIQINKFEIRNKATIFFIFLVFFRLYKNLEEIIKRENIKISWSPENFS